MSATPASASLPPGPTALAAKLFPGNAETGTGTDAATDLFAAHFQHLLGKQLTVELDVGQMPDPPAADNAPSDDLAALLPFIEALGLAQTTTPATAPASLPTASAPLGAPAISAANPSAQGQAHGSLSNPQTRPVGAEKTAEALPNAIAGNGEPAKEASVGREFSAQLGAAIAASKEAPHAPGTTAAAVQNIVAQAAPGRVASQEAAPVIPQPVGAPGWTEEIGNRIAWLANRSESRAELVLTPPQMGRVEISLTVKGDQATASFASNNPVVREALEAALPRLREILADAGIQLGQAQVGAENARQWAQQEKHGDNSGFDPARAKLGDAAISPISSGSLATTSGLKGGRGLVDVFA